MAGTITVTGASASLISGAKTIGPLTITGSATIGEIWEGTLASGDNTIAVPTGATACVITPPTANAVQLKLRTNRNSSDGGLEIGLTAPVVYPFGTTAPTSIIINAASLTSGLTEISFI